MVFRKDNHAVVEVACQKQGAPDFRKAEIVPVSELRGAGRLFSVITLPAGSEISEHEHHEEYEVYYILSGEGTYVDNGIEIRVFAGDSTLCREGGKHALINDGSEELSFVAFIGFPNKDKTP